MKNITKSFILSLISILLAVEIGVPQARRQQTKATTPPGTIANIRRVDFLNSTYHPFLCAEVFGIPETVRVRRGTFQDSDSYYRVAGNKVIYGDVTADAGDEAVVHIRCGGFAGNFNNSEILVYALQKGETKLVSELDTKTLEADYQRYFPGGFLVTVTDNLKIVNGHLIVEILADGSNAAPKFMVSLDYKQAGGSLALSGRPQRRRTKY